MCGGSAANARSRTSRAAGPRTEAVNVAADKPRYRRMPAAWAGGCGRWAGHRITLAFGARGILMFTELMTSRRFVPLFWCQFCSALNDNLLKNALVMLILFGLGSAGGVTGRYAPVLVTLAGVTLIAPFFFLSALGGELADRYDKARVAANIKLAEIPMAGLAALGFYLHSVPILFATLALFGIVAALFGPVKYGILPEKLKT